MSNTNTSENAAPAKAAENVAADAVAAASEAYTAAGNEAMKAIKGMDLAVPEAIRSAAEKVVTQSRDAYDRSKDAVEDTVEMFEQSIDKAGQGAATINRKVIDIAQANLNSSFDLAKNLAGSKNVAELVEHQTAFARKQFETLSAQAEEIRSLSTQVATDSVEPLKAHVERSVKTLKVN